MANSDTSAQAGTTTNKHVVVCNDGYTSPPLSQTWIASDVTSVAFSPDGNTVVSGSFDITIKLWDVSTGVALQTWTGHTYYVTSVAFSPDGNTVVSGSSDNTIKLWNVSSGVVLQTWTGHTSNVNSVAFSPDGNTVVSGS